MLNDLFDESNIFDIDITSNYHIFVEKLADNEPLLIEIHDKVDFVCNANDLHPHNLLPTATWTEFWNYARYCIAVLKARIEYHIGGDNNA